MKSISFKNFRRYADFPELEFGNITILVGGNNAGKSTLQKALLLVLDNLKSLKKNASVSNESDDDFYCPQFRFDANEIHDLNLGTFKRSLFNRSERQEMEFTLSTDEFRIRVVVEPDASGEDLPIAKVARIEVKDDKYHILYIFDFNTKRMRVEFEATGTLVSAPEINSVLNRIFDLRNKLSKENNPIEAARINEEIEKLKNVSKACGPNKGAVESASVEIDLHNYLGVKRWWYGINGRLSSYIENFDAYRETISRKGRVSGEKDLEQQDDNVDEFYNVTEADYANEQILADKETLIMKSAWGLRLELRRPRIYYIQAHGVSQKMLYTIDDKNDFMAQAIHKYARLGIVRGSDTDMFIRKWMSEFGIGKDYNILPIGGEGYTFKVKTDDDDEGVNLADMGMGANQLMVLLLSLATIMYEEGYQGDGGRKNNIPRFIAIEEPEQNLHPKLQSKLADLIAEVAKKENYKFLIETHSEYLIRRTQVLVAEMNLREEELEKQNPFKVYYFPADGVPYDMKYRRDGRFAEEFGAGFFDEASNLAISLF